MAILKVKNYPAHLSFNNFIDDFFNDLPSVNGEVFNNGNKKQFVPSNVIETENEYKLEVMVPGFNKEDIKIDLDKNILTVSAEVKKGEGESKKFIRKEYQIESFKRSFTVSKNIDTQNIEAAYNNGILTIHLPKKADVKEPVKNISVN